MTSTNVELTDLEKRVLTPEQQESRRYWIGIAGRWWGAGPMPCSCWGGPCDGECGYSAAEWDEYEKEGK